MSTCLAEKDNNKKNNQPGHLYSLKNPGNKGGTPPPSAPPKGVKNKGK